MGFDSVADDYKVVRVIEFKDDDRIWVGSETRVYSLKSNSWKKIQDFPYGLVFLSDQPWGVPLDGGFHALVKQNPHRDWPKLLVCVDFTTEGYKILPLPDTAGDKLVGMSLERLGKSLCLVALDSSFHLEVWVMKDYGVRESWTKFLCTPARGFVVGGVDVPFIHLHIVAYSKCGSKILFTWEYKKFVWFDLKRRAFVGVPVHDLPPMFHAYVCAHSLVRPDTYGKLVENKERKPKMKDKKTRNQR